MKKTLSVIMLSLVLVLSACSSNTEKDERSLQSFIDAFVAAGTEVDPAEKPMFQAIGAKDGVIFYIDGNKVAIYEYESTSELEKIKKENTLITDWQENGKFIIEASNEDALQIFTEVK